MLRATGISTTRHANPSVSKIHKTPQPHARIESPQMINVGQKPSRASDTNGNDILKVRALNHNVPKIEMPVQKSQPVLNPRHLPNPSRQTRI